MALEEVIDTLKRLPEQPSPHPGNPAAYWEATALRLQLLRALLPLAGPFALEEEDEAAASGAGRKRGDYTAEPRRQPVVGIVEVSQDSDDEDDSGSARPGAARLAALKQQQQRRRLAAAALEVAALYSAGGSGGGFDDDAVSDPDHDHGGDPWPAEAAARDAFRPVGAAAAGCGDQELVTSAPLLALARETWLESLRLPTPWADAAAARLAGQLVATLAGLLAQSSDGSGGGGIGGGGGGGSGARQEAPPEGRALRSAVVQWLLPGLREPLFAPHRHTQAQERGSPDAYSGPGPFQRSLAARKLAWAAQQLPCPLLTAPAAAALLPLALAASDDASGPVSRLGAAALHRLAAAAPPGALEMQRELLLARARRLVVGCEGGVWGSAMPAAVAVVLALEPQDDPRSEALHSLFKELLTEAERAAHKLPQRLVFLACAARLLPRLRLHAARHLPCAAPLLLEWSVTHDAGSRAAALGCLEALLLCCWPRAAAHGAVVWRYLLAAARAVDLDGFCGDWGSSAAAEGGGEKGGGGRAEGGDGGAAAAAVLSAARLLLAICGPQDLAAAGGAAAAQGSAADKAGPCASALHALLAQASVS
ncbi:hypothetical protein MNEG_0621 [Monoraphidium neglectum]|uniref:Uncharacterized protein n=1 Tax=Monoraphidium neglectum TaxID=145388 RepID=A0A0D2LLT9_9CHLO|nr:hypothetical protein MNEG_0621 [Monoraphidium neglectum]KIZ07334.1 hypothetical protein MNEG_0621 [Monoraphidium neglectum]|eukprot:XP_013906353.1 hypothetical protein MNEG_0621 [Monoraphidium neglectum]